MKFAHEMRYDASPEAVFAMLGDPAFREQVAQRQGLLRSTAEIARHGAGMTVRLDQVEATKGIPGFAKKFVGDEVQLVSTESWSGPEAATLDLTIPGKPGRLDATITLTPDGAGTVEAITGDLKVGIPLVAGKLESLISGLLKDALKVEETVGREWLAGR